MNQYVIYQGKDGYVKARQLNKGETFADVSAKATANGFEVLRPHALVGNSAQEAVTNYEKASQLRQEGANIAEKGKTISADTQRSMDEIQSTKDKQQAMEEAQAYGNNASGKLGANALLKQQGRSIPKLITVMPSLATDLWKRYKLGDTSVHPGENFADRYALPYESDLAQEVLGDPTLVPSMFVPGVGEERALNIASKVLPAIAKGGKIEKFVAPALRMGTDVGAQTVASEVPDIATGEVSPEETTKRLLMGIGGSAGAELAGKGLVTGGRNILQSVIKPKTGSDVDMQVVDELMGATLPDSKKKVIGAFSSLSTMYKDIEDAITAYGEKQAGSLDKTQNIGLINNINNEIKVLRRNLQSDLDSRKINEEAFNKASDILDMEERRLMGTSLTKTGTPSPISEMNLHKAKKDYGDKSRYDITNSATSDPTSRETNRDLYAMTRKLITDSQLNDLIKQGNVVGRSIDTPTGTAEKIKQLTALVKDENLPIDEWTKAFHDLRNLLSSTMGNLTDYGNYSKAMAPVMNARDPVGKALERTNRNQSLTLPMLMGATAGGASGHGLTGTIAGALIPTLLNAPIAGTTAYRAGEAIPTLADRYAIPALMRTENQ